jgi:hypothetical protein
MEERTVREKIGDDAQRPLAAVIGFKGMTGDLVTDLQDFLADTMHAIEAVAQEDSDYPDPRSAVLAAVERAVADWWSESVYAIDHGDESSDVLGGIPIHRAEVSVYADFTKVSE